MNQTATSLHKMTFVFGKNQHVYKLDDADWV